MYKLSPSIGKELLKFDCCHTLLKEIFSERQVKGAIMIRSSRSQMFFKLGLLKMSLSQANACAGVSF